jgi:hypothetical protein
MGVATSTIDSARASRVPVRSQTYASRNAKSEQTSPMDQFGTADPPTPRYSFSVYLEPARNG